MERDDEERLIVRFRAGGVREICWHLITWGETVEIISPARLVKEMNLLHSAVRSISESGQQSS